jgi:hypothetical protein
MDLREDALGAIWQRRFRAATKVRGCPGHALLDAERARGVVGFLVLSTGKRAAFTPTLSQREREKLDCQKAGGECEDAGKTNEVCADHGVSIPQKF